MPRGCSFHQGWRRTYGMSHQHIWLQKETCVIRIIDQSLTVHQKDLNKTHIPITEFTFLEVFFPKAQMQAHSAGTVKLARDHWLSTYCPMTGPTFPTRAKLEETRSHTWNPLTLNCNEMAIKLFSKMSDLTQSADSVWCLSEQICAQFPCHSMHTERMSHGWN